MLSVQYNLVKNKFYAFHCVRKLRQLVFYIVGEVKHSLPLSVGGWDGKDEDWPPALICRGKEN